MTRNNNFTHGIDQIIAAVEETHPKDAAVLRRYIDDLRVLQQRGCNKYSIDTNKKYQAWGTAVKVVIRGTSTKRLYYLLLAEEAALEPEIIA